ncbi:FRG domain-containing protein [Agarivorans sp. TSD2052]|uniref:FRG domain-containing protein n=1 Tax=Agarivorans sp. TSD2052 TaxID=2937286 RepID=UPI00200D39C0|nr:FRG domain-containing protein [Agarivorans sp. TSD2052]UPW17793.1 FRG domain-containing protein [Agarivorans sp. TSD2052]
MKIHNVSSFSELHEILSVYRKSNRWVFRGHADPHWVLTPKAGREPYNKSDDLTILQAWKRRAVEYVTNAPENDWDWLATAQHHGLATRLLDWSYNPMVAAYFATTHQYESDSHIYCYKPHKILIPQHVPPKDYDSISLFKPNGVVPRIARQGGVFTTHGQPNKPLGEVLHYEDELELIVIDKNYVKELGFELNHYGINDAFTFPDLDGLSRHVNWYTENQDYWVAQALTLDDASNISSNS